MEKKRATVRYISGNTARQLQAVPERKRRERQEKQKKELSQSVKKNREKALQMSMGYVLFLAAVTITVVVVCFNYLKLHADISATTSNITNLTSSIDTLTAQNDALDYSINSYTDVNYIVRVAVEELGMVQASKDQVSYYKSTESEFMKQFTDVPEE
ncbi:MAG: cell division protein FtsL [Lachnospiraceae bacterium]|nr:cell division protein FtsL [Lachnospiraceae bacterium]